jgi:hypothetical protein
MPLVNNVRTTPGSDVKFFANTTPDANSVAKVDAVPTVAGPPGPQGVGIRSITISDSDDLLFTLTDNTTIDAGTLPPGPTGPTGPTGVTGPPGPIGNIGPQGIKGDKGDTGATGTAGIPGVQGPKGDKGDTGLTGSVGPEGDHVTNAVINGSNHIIFTLSDNSTIDAGLLPPGPTGNAGPTGPQGPQGVDVANATINGSNHLIFTLSNSAVIDAGPLPPGPTGGIGPTGPAGPAGPQGNASTVAGPAGPAGPNFETVVNLNTATGTVTLDLGSNSFYNLTLTGNVTIAFSNTALTTRSYTAVVSIKQNSSGAGTFTVTWPGTCNTPGNVVYSQSTGLGATDLYTVFTINGGASYFLSQIGQLYS